MISAAHRASAPGCPLSLFVNFRKLTSGSRHLLRDCWTALENTAKSNRWAPRLLRPAAVLGLNALK
jgi:hypothetical protein